MADHLEMYCTGDRTLSDQWFPAGTGFCLARADRSRDGRCTGRAGLCTEYGKEYRKNGSYGGYDPSAWHYYDPYGGSPVYAGRKEGVPLEKKRIAL